MRIFQLFLILALSLSFIHCKKSVEEEWTGEGSILGRWEVRQSMSGMMPLTNHPAGNGNQIIFDSTTYKYIFNGQVAEQGTYELVRDSVIEVNSCELVPASGSGPNRIKFQNNPIRLYFELSGNTLKTFSGCFALDGGWSIYKKIASE